MGKIWRKTALPKKKPTENAIKALSEDLIATQETAAMLYEENAAKDEQIADMEDMIAQLYEGGAALV